MNLFSSLKNGINEGYHFIPSSHHPFFVFSFPLKKSIHKATQKKEERKAPTTTPKREKMESSGSQKESWRNCNLKFIWQINFMASCIAVDPESCEAKLIFSFHRLSFILGGCEEKSEKKFMPSLRFYSFWNVPQMLHIFSHFDFYRYARWSRSWLYVESAAISTLSLGKSESLATWYSEIHNLCARRFKSTRDALALVSREEWKLKRGKTKRARGKLLWTSRLQDRTNDFYVFRSSEGS